MTALLHFRAQRRDDLFRNFRAPLLGAAEAILEHGRLHSNELLADGGPIEDEDLLQLGLGELYRINARDDVDDFAAALLESGAMVCTDSTIGFCRSGF